MRRLLTGAGCRVETFASPAQFLSSEARLGADCLILDVELGKENGIDLHRRMGVAANVPVIYMSALDDPRTRERAMRAGAGAFLPKNCDPEVLTETIRRVVAARAQGASVGRK